MNHTVELHTLLEEVRRAAEELAGSSGPGQGQDAMQRFLPAVYRLGLLVTRAPELRESPDLDTFLQGTAPLLVREWIPLAESVDRLENRFYGTWEWDWYQACEARSAIEFLLDLYRDTLVAGLRSELDLEELDRLMRFRGAHDGFFAPSQIPDGIPRSHWWWWAPDSPPGGAEPATS